MTIENYFNFRTQQMVVLQIVLAMLRTFTILISALLALRFSINSMYFRSILSTLFPLM
jgi:hypothetical protein